MRGTGIYRNLACTLASSGLALVLAMGAAVAGSSAEDAKSIEALVPIPDGAGSLSSQIAFGSSLLLDKVVIDLNITHRHVGDLTVTLTSPTGTTATLASHPASGTGSGRTEPRLRMRFHFFNNADNSSL